MLRSCIEIMIIIVFYFLYIGYKTLSRVSFPSQMCRKLFNCDYWVMILYNIGYNCKFTIMLCSLFCGLRLGKAIYKLYIVCGCVLIGCMTITITRRRNLGKSVFDIDKLVQDITKIYIKIAIYLKRFFRTNNLCFIYYPSA